MKIVVFGDVHGNLVALEKMFQIEKNEADLFICHGDVLNYGPWSNECVSLLSEIENCSVLTGNHETYFLEGVYPGEHPIAKAFFDFCYPIFDKQLIKNISNYKLETSIQDYIISHTINNQYIFKDTDISNISVESNHIIGHSHQQFKREIGSFKLFNTGSIGQNREFINQSCYLKLDTNKNEIELKNFIHDIGKVVNEMKSKKYPSICLDYYLSKKQI